MGKYKRSTGSASSESTPKAAPSPRVVPQELIDELDEEEAVDVFEDEAIAEPVSVPVDNEALKGPWPFVLLARASGRIAGTAAI